MTDFQNIYEAEYNILKLIKNDNNCSAHFDYKIKDSIVELSVITYNPVHNTFFLLHTLKNENKLECLKNMYNYIYDLKTSMKSKKKGFCHYTIEWFCPVQKQKFTSCIGHPFFSRGNPLYEFPSRGYKPCLGS